MDGRLPSNSTSTSSLTSSQLPRPTNLRSSVSMFIEDSRITAVANANVSPFQGGGGAGATSPSSSFYSVTSFTSAPPSRSVATSSWNLRPTFRQISATLPEPPQSCPPSSGSVHSSPTHSRACSSSPVRFSSRRSSGSREIVHKIIRESIAENDGECGMPPPIISSPTSATTSTSTRAPLRRTSLNVEPVVSVINVKENLATLPRLREDRAYTSVNLTLRSPSSSTPPQGIGGSGPTTAITQDFDHHPNASVNVVNTVVDLEAGASASFHHVHHYPNHHHPTNLMYSTYSNSRDGFEAQVQIQFGPHGGTFTASRRRNHNISIHQMNSDLLSAQTERKDKLRVSINDRKCLLAKLQTEIVQLRSQLQLNPFSELEKLKQENQRLRIECDFMTREVDLYQYGSVPLGETNEEFYQCINPGQSVDALFGITNNRRRVGNQPPPRPPPPKFLQSPSQPDASPSASTPTVAGSPDGEWRCSMCTFLNHRDLDFCEQCQMVRVKHGQSREQNIRIRVVRHQQQQPPQQRRVVHSWVM